jgi:hypothetical protein
MDREFKMSEGRHFNTDRQVTPKPSEDQVFVHRLKVDEAMASDAGRNIARIDGSSLILLGIKVGDTLVVKGKSGRSAAVLCQDSMLLELEPVIRLDKIMRYNLGVEIGASISADNIEVVGKPHVCSELTLEPVSLGVPAAVDERYISRALQGITLVENQIVVVPYYGGRWYPYAVTRISNDDDDQDEDDASRHSAALFGPKTIVKLGWR